MFFFEFMDLTMRFANQRLGLPILHTTYSSLTFLVGQVMMVSLSVLVFAHISVIPPRHSWGCGVVDSWQFRASLEPDFRPPPIWILYGLDC